MTDAPINARKLRAWMVEYIASVLGVDENRINLSQPFDVYGLDSAEAVIMAGVMEEEFKVEIDPNVIFEDPSIDGVVRSFQATGLAA